MTYIAAFVLMLLSFGIIPQANAQDKLTRIHKNIVTNYPDLTHISRQTLALHLSQDPQSLLIFDTRTRAEYAVSHIAGAHFLNPKIQLQDFWRQYGHDLPNKTIIFYCSVGRRSSRLAYRLLPGLKARGATNIFNLQGGLFGWHNDTRPLVNAQGATTDIHPYNIFWKAHLKHTNRIRYTPE